MNVPLFLVHVTGDRPHYINLWTKPYRTMSAASGQATRYVTDHRGERNGDWCAYIYRLEPTPDLIVADEHAFRLVQVSP